MQKNGQTKHKQNRYRRSKQTSNISRANTKKMGKLKAQVKKTKKQQTNYKQGQKYYYVN